MVSDKEIGTTATGEIFQPIRLHYQAFNRHKIEKDFNRLRCIEFDTSKKRWVWLYNEEAKSIDFENKFSSIPEEIRPIIVGSFVWKSSDALVLDVRSYERALEAIKFFDKEISRATAKVTHCSVLSINNQPNFEAITSFLDNEMERFFEVENFQFFLEI